jgi:hypothetical protein
MSRKNSSDTAGNRTRDLNQLRHRIPPSPKLHLLLSDYISDTDKEIMRFRFSVTATYTAQRSKPQIQTPYIKVTHVFYAGVNGTVSLSVR